jgi:hypothetical protein
MVVCHVAFQSYTSVFGVHQVRCIGHGIQGTYISDLDTLHSLAYLMYYRIRYIQVFREHVNYV